MFRDQEKHRAENCNLQEVGLVDSYETQSFIFTGLIDSIEINETYPGDQHRDGMV
jgi:hypothetical protein